MKLKKIAEIIKGNISGNPEYEVLRLSSLNNAKEGSLTFLQDSNIEKAYDAIQNNAAIIFKKGLDIRGIIPQGIAVDKPYLSFIKIIHLFSGKENKVNSIHKTAIIDKSVKIGKNVNIGPFVIIDKDSIISDNVEIGANTTIGKNVFIDQNTKIYEKVTIMNSTKIGGKVIIFPGVVIGSDGFGYLPGDNIKIPHIGNVIIKDNVEIGANTTIDRAMLDSTIIGENTKIDNLIQIAHNVIIGKNCLIASQTGISGSCIIGDNVMMAGQVGLADHTVIGDNVIIMAQSGVRGKIKKNSVIFGTPARDAKIARRIVASLPYLPDAIKKIKKIK